MTPDVNALAAAFRADRPHHAVARVWLQEALNASGEGAGFTLTPVVLAPIDEAVAFADVPGRGQQRPQLLLCRVVGSGW